MEKKTDIQATDPRKTLFATEGEQQLPLRPGTPLGGLRLHELAMAYFPSPCRASSVRRLRRWILADRLLREALEQTGYRPGQRYLTARQVDTFRRILGDPMPATSDKLPPAARRFLK